MKFLILAAALFVSTAATAAPVTGNDLLTYCRSHNAVEKAYCEAFLLATADTSQSLDRVCLPEGVTFQQVKDFVIKLLVEQPQERHLSAAMLVSVWLERAWPCTKGREASR